MTEKTYVLDGVEVALTGRKAHKEWKQIVRGREIPRVDFIVEVKPVSKDMDWKKWVKKEELYEVIEEKQQENHNPKPN